jgi:formylglycine-generating enzyme required for sulfatase activity
MCPQLVLLPKGDFFMGGSPDEMSDDLENMTGLARLLNESRELESTPKHLVKITHNILFGKYDITVGEYSNFISETGYNTKGGCWIKNKYKYIFSYSASWDNPGFYQTSKNPVVCISWNDARSYIEWINKKLQTLNNNTVLSLYRLPYENEWEYAARSGKKTTRWWGNDISANKANCQGCGSKWGGQGTSPVGSFEPNQFGLYDMLGNAGQWVEDCWHPNYDNAPGVDSVWSNGSCDKHVMRGGTWLNEAWAVRASIRFKFDTNDRFNCIGFRVVKYVL